MQQQHTHVQCFSAVCIGDVCTVQGSPWKAGDVPGRLNQKLDGIERPVGHLNVESNFPCTKPNPLNYDETTEEQVLRCGLTVLS